MLLLENQIIAEYSCVQYTRFEHCNQYANEKATAFLRWLFWIFTLLVSVAVIFVVYPQS